ncbi:hypothetical protein [Nonomuraea jiangxiensis]|uniref:Uncharacterized protein n=1 Tax=Nonomuraea jiangxiensis TaxID=633440 RepID=A0A1G8JUZ8_9ACTN|nr:hypothetical protein [Nonomuraea jiangxiensis]SDI34420.1 hypothetical protein SAMN05421869_105180 [Nonomuraea jiangxiensis]
MSARPKIAALRGGNVTLAAAADTAARAAEILALNVEDLDLERREVTEVLAPRRRTH